MRKKFGVLFATLALFSGCGKSQVEEKSRLLLDKTELVVCVGESVRLTATLENASAEPVYTWRTSDSAIVTVQDGVVLGVGVGVARISVQTRENTASCKVTVTKTI